MTEKKKPKVIVLENNDDIRQRVESILSKEGWEVTCEQTSKNALHLLGQDKQWLFALFISNFKLPKMEGDDILQTVKSISPLTQRMLLVPADKPDTLINAINKAAINACITLPFNDQDLVDQARICFKQFKHAIKRQQLKRVTGHQNKQMFKIAQNLKKKEIAYKHLIDEKKTQRVSLKLKKREIENKTDLNTNISLSKLIEHKEINPTSEGFKKEFLIVCNTIKKLFDKVTTRHHSNMIHITLEQILIPGKPGEDSTESISATPEQSEKNKTDTAESSQNQLDSKQVLQENEDSSIELIEKIIKTAYTQAINAKDQGLSDSPEADGSCTEETDCVLDDLFEISISENQTTAFIKKTKKFDGNSQLPVLPDIQDMLRQKQISYGILDDEAIKTWMSKSSVEKIVIASGLEPVHGHDGEIKYHFETNFTNPGKISDDGSIDFRERGDIPYVRKTDLLAQKTPSKEGKPGISVSGINIPVNEVNDPVFVPGPGTELSEDGLAIHAAIDGQPHLDALGTVSVNPELVIPGDIDFETGNIDFKGNIVVKGMIKEGFTVKGINLTAKEIEGGTIDLSGDLNISAGITDSTISAQGNIYAKFINHSTIMGFGNLCVSKEIIDSNIIISGSCQNQTGHIISSNITAKLGIEAGKIGTTASKPAKLMVGMDEHIEMLKKQVEESLEKSMNKSTSLKDDIIKLEDKDQELYRQISEKAHIQDRAQIEIKELEKSIPELEKSNDRVKLQQISKDIQKLIDRAKDAEKELNTIFETQDSIANEIERLKNQINLSEETNKKLVLERKALKDFSKKNTPIAIVSIAKTITQDSIVRGPHASIILKEDTSRCKIQELASQDEGIKFHEMTISDI